MSESDTTERFDTEVSPEQLLDGLFRTTARVQGEIQWNVFIAGQMGAMFEAAKTDDAVRERLAEMVSENWATDLQDLEDACQKMLVYMEMMRQHALANLGLNDGDGKPIDEVHPQLEPELPHVIMDDMGVVARFPTVEEANSFLALAKDDSLRYMLIEESE